MQVFIMWAGERSHAIARDLKDFLEFVVREPDYFISDDIEGGRLWRVAIAGQLEAASFGIACLTRDNLRSHWLHFEAGALSKAMGQANVIPLLIGPQSSDLDGPLKDFMALDSDEAGIRKLVSLLASGVPARKQKIIDKSFDFVWPEFAEKLKRVRGPVDEVIAARKKEVLALLDRVEVQTTSRAMENAVAEWRRQIEQSGLSLEEIVAVHKKAKALEAHLIH